MRKITIIHPSRNRPMQAIATCNKWLGSAKFPKNIEYIFSLDEDDQLLNKYKENLPAGTECFVLWNKTAIDAINKAAHLSSGDIIIVVSDDFNECPIHWDTGLLGLIDGRRDFIAKTNDGLQPWIITLPILDRAYYNRFGYIYNPEYRHMFCDTEMTAVGDLLGRKIVLPITFRHNHYSTGKTPIDSVNQRNDATWAQGEAVYLRRIANNFGLKNPPGYIECDQAHVDWLIKKGLNFTKQ